MSLTNINYLGRNPSDNSHNWKEWEVQSYIVMELRRAGYIIHGDANGASKTPKGWAQAKVTGALAGWPDMCVLLPKRPIWIELKVGAGRTSKEQVALHDAMQDMGHEIYVVHADCPTNGLGKVLNIINPPPRLRAACGGE